MGNVMDKKFLPRGEVHHNMETAVEVGNFMGSNVLVVKKYIINLNTTEKKTVNEFIAEYTTLVNINHPNIIKVYGGSYDKVSPYIIEEYAPYDALDKVLKNKSINITKELVMKLAKDIAKGLEHVHKKGIIHRDIKSGNIMIFSLDVNGVCAKIGDFGTSRSRDKNMTNCVGSLCWMSPEMYNNEEYSYSSDIFSLGIVFWEIMMRKTPFEEGASLGSITKKVASGLAPIINAAEMEKFRELCELYNKCTRFTPSERPSASQVLMELRGPIPKLNIRDVKVKSRSCETSPRTKSSRDIFLPIK
jgi:serine/threonine protein kinase